MTWGKTENSLSLSRRSSAGYRTNTDYEIYNALWQTRLNLPAENKMDLQLGYNEKKFGANSFYSAKYPNQYEHTQRMIASLRGDLGGERLRLLPLSIGIVSTTASSWCVGRPSGRTTIS